MPQLPWLPLAVACLAGSAPLSAQWQTPPDAHDFSKLKGADSALVTWVERDNANVHLIKMRNNARHPVEIAEWEIYNCFNIRSKDCGRHAKPTRIEPGKTITLQAVRRDYARSGWQWQYRFRSRFLVPADTALVPRDQLPPDVAQRLPGAAAWQRTLMSALQQRMAPSRIGFHTGNGEFLELTVPRPDLAANDPSVMDSLRAFAEFAAAVLPPEARFDSVRVHIETAPDGNRTRRATVTFPMAVLRR